MQRRRAPVIGVSLMALLIAGFVASKAPGGVMNSGIDSSVLTAQVALENTPPLRSAADTASVSPFPEVRGTSIIVGLIILAVGGGILAYAKRR